MLKKRINNFIKHPKKALFTLSLPIILAMFVQTMYNVVDTAFVGRLGADSIAALTFSFPLFFILIAIGTGLGIGTNSRIARYLGAKKHKAAENTAMHGLLSAILLAFVVFIFGLIFIRPLFNLFGATGAVTKLGIDYMSIIFAGALFMLPSFVMNNIFAAQGDTKTPMKVQISALFLNMALDPVFIYGFGLGVRGAAIATVCALLFEVVVFSYLIHTKSHLHIKKKSFNFSFRIIKDIFAVGIPGSLTMLIISVYVGFINKFVAFFGTEYIAAFGLAWKLENVAAMPAIALSMGLMTLVGLFYGAKRYDLVKLIIKYELKIEVTFMIVMGCIFFIIPGLLLRTFTSDTLLIGIAASYVRITVFTFPLMSILFSLNRAMQGMGHGLPGMVTNLVRVFVVALPLAYLFVFKLGYGYLSIVFAMIAGGVVSSIMSIIWTLAIFRKHHI